MSKRNKGKILTETHAKVMIRDGELRQVFNKQELQTFFDLINKIKDYDLREEKKEAARVVREEFAKVIFKTC